MPGFLVVAHYLLFQFAINLGITKESAFDIDLLVADGVSSALMIGVKESLFTTSFYLLVATS